MRRLTTEEFINLANEIHNHKFDYELSNYINSHSKIKILCKIHGVFEQMPYTHLNGSGCRKCGIDRRVKLQTKTLDEFINQASLKHKDENNIPLYRYEESNYVNSKTKIKIFCKKCDKLFKQTPDDHLSGYGCNRCGVEKCTKSRTKTFEQFLKDTEKYHLDKNAILIYGYERSNYINSELKIEILCKKCDKYFWQAPAHHLSGQGCPICSTRKSKLEIQWLKSLNIASLETQKYFNICGKKYIVDGYDPQTKIIYEFNGDFFHGNLNKFLENDINPISKKTFGELYQKTLQKEQDLKNAGYTVISIWESDFKKQIK